MAAVSQLLDLWSEVFLDLRGDEDEYRGRTAPVWRYMLLGMSNLSLQDQIWNRACIEAGGATPAVGDEALASVLRAHGLAMNGGVIHALESLSRVEILAAVAGFKFFGLTDAARVFQQVPGDSDETESRLNKLYFAAVPTDEALAHAFRLKLASTPEAFAPLSNGAHA